MSIIFECKCDRCGKKDEALLDEAEQWNCPRGWAELIQPYPYERYGIHLCPNCIPKEETRDE